MTTPFRLLVTEPLDGALNMALDEALLLGRLRDLAPPTLRFFSWQPATISLGYGQALDHRIDVAAAAALGIGLVRRPTGGSAILHEGPELELTYSVAARTGDFEGAGELLETYRWIGAALAADLGSSDLGCYGGRPQLARALAAPCPPAAPGTTTTLPSTRPIPSQTLLPRCDRRGPRAEHGRPHAGANRRATSARAGQSSDS